MLLLQAFIVTVLTGSISAHGIITTPYPRAVGPASIAACGDAVTDLIVADNTSHVEGLPEASVTDSGYNKAKCNLWLCKGLQYADNTENVISVSPGEVLPFEVFIRIPHEGTANVSIVDTKKNSIIGSELLYWDRYADEKLTTLPANNSAFSVTIPRHLEGKCLDAGDCVSILHRQSYIESC